ncbi:hypothetical protein A4U64_16665 [Rhodococcus sp. WB1]|uniref:Uncharacterized protein n=1 Tax=Rhodococcus aetherivorans TaxID=191292 RepID=A0AA46PFA0_9NOCA|nr:MULTISPECIES: hypothetical protein [Rhodococcus]ANZ26124.1 hypothetical protein A4U64_16665 [Rhodococcus sp. WB1]MDV6292651.1 hypothetical protein [Rhodococcus aetherivorans]USC16885.1 hypothetical protein KZJ41_08475 [Rhodococcus sp. 11-3]UYF92934.1 hypothetical protein OCS65_21035 [Rhodococcus aetherivorans]
MATRPASPTVSSERTASSERAAPLVESPGVGWILLTLFGLGGGLVAASIAGSFLIGISVVLLVGGLAAVLVAVV